MSAPACTCPDTPAERLRLWNARAQPVIVKLIERGHLRVRELRYTHKLVVAIGNGRIALDPRMARHSHHRKDCPCGQWMRANYTVEMAHA